MCAHDRAPIDADERAAGVQYDRCSPSLLAFAKEEEAIQFTRQHGGTVLPFRAVAAEFAK
jgi:nitrous oxide reductase accessory protein NosL